MILSKYGIFVPLLIHLESKLSRGRFVSWDSWRDDQYHLGCLTTIPTYLFPYGDNHAPEPLPFNPKYPHNVLYHKTVYIRCAEPPLRELRLEICQNPSKVEETPCTMYESSMFAVRSPKTKRIRTIREGGGG